MIYEEKPFMAKSVAGWFIFLGVCLLLVILGKSAYSWLDDPRWSKGDKLNTTVVEKNQ